MFVEDEDNPDFEEKTSQDSQNVGNNFSDSEQDMSSILKEFLNKYQAITEGMYNTSLEESILFNQKMGTSNAIISALHYYNAYTSLLGSLIRVQPRIHENILSESMVKIDKEIDNINLSIEKIKKKVEEIRATLPQKEVR